ncbi:pectinesterase family protein [Simiduia agarivorans]|uniref:Pectinesterase n=1 Tax=Simiduia agarivorans (strain DSM 21679 / JCM 13881 / BCRC 17597 / SA1) TaxID=1117647 RepID=K4KM07_SIMAS|nr:pectinesterase family protein [Simiduia agarivorans]AFU99250.1 pectinesterase [Simiduia agarivorans SA1 = DSM 21679]
MLRYCLFFFCLVSGLAHPASHLRVGPDQTYATIQAAVDAANGIDGPVVIHIAAGQYLEKVYITRDQLALVGAGPDKTIIEFAELREHWRAHAETDWGAAVVNINASDVALLDLTVLNSYGQRTGDHDHQFAVRSLQGTRIITDNCRLISGGADTLSLWDKNGMYYHSRCYFEGYVDQVCPRGWAYITDSEFFTRSPGHALWHDGDGDPAKALVVVNSRFSGEPGYRLGRRHYDASFWLINPRFDRHLNRQPLYRKTYPDEPTRDRPNHWGDRYYFSGAASVDFSPLPAWAATNMPPVRVSPALAFGDRWQPERDLARWRARIAGAE